MNTSTNHWGNLISSKKEHFTPSSFTVSNIGLPLRLFSSCCSIFSLLAALSGFMQSQQIYSFNCPMMKKKAQKQKLLILLNRLHSAGIPVYLFPILQNLPIFIIVFYLQRKEKLMIVIQRQTFLT